MQEPYPSFSRYTIERKLGKGGMGSIYVALQSGLNRHVALKVPHHFLDESALTRFIREGETLAKLSHPNVVRVYDAGVEKGEAFLAMELIEGENLDDRIKRALPSVHQLIRWGIDLANALEYIHSQQVIHRDIKNQNIIINDQNQPVLVDFGLARNNTMTQITLNDRAFLGTFIYASPESFGGTFLTPKSDIYSLGVVLYKCLTDTYPYDGETPQEFINNLFQTNHKPAHEINPEVPPWLSDILDKCLQKTPDHRLHSSELQKALKAGLNEGVSKPVREQLLTQTIITANPEPTTDKTKKTDRKKPASKPHLLLTTRSLLLSIALIILVAAGIFAYATNFFTHTDTTNEAVNESRPPSVIIPVTIDSLMQAHSVDGLETMLKDYRKDALLTYSGSPSSFDDPGSCYIVVYNAEGVTTILNPENTNGQRTDLQSNALVTAPVEDLFPESAYLWLLLL